MSSAPEGWREEDDEDAEAADLELGLELELERELQGGFSADHHLRKCPNRYLGRFLPPKQNEWHPLETYI